MTTHRKQENPFADDIARLLRPAVDSAAEESIKPFFVDRLMKAVASPTQVRRAGEDLFEAMFGLFRPVALASLLIIATLVGYNIRSASDSDVAVSVSESVLGLPSVSLVAAFELQEE